MHDHKDLVSAGQTLSPWWLTQDSPAKHQLTPYLSTGTLSPHQEIKGLLFPDPIILDQATHPPNQVTPHRNGQPEVPNSQERAQTPSDGKHSTHSEIPHFSLKNTQWSFISLPAGLNNILNAKIYMQTLINVFHYSLYKTTFQPKHSINVIKLLPGGII